MNNNTNSIDLLYLTNIGKNKSKTTTNCNMVDRKDVEFYKKRIFQKCKELLRGKKENITINEAFDHFCLTLIEHFKMIDKNEIIQNEYKELEEEAQTSLPHKELEEGENPDELMFKKIEKNDYNLDKFVIKHVVKKEPQIHIPKEKDYNLKDIKYQEKDVEIKSKTSAVAMAKKKRKNKKKLKNGKKSIDIDITLDD
tara:strand:+ start:1794 stop:2384 length:591 start_codon:yes stop_codon:yes gene_type:complete